MKQNETQIHQWNMADTVTSLRVATVVLVRLVTYAMAAAKYHRFASLHTWLNKLTGGAAFLLPYVLVLSSGVIYSWFVCVLALTASTEELAIHLCRNEYRADRKTIFQRDHTDEP